MCAMLGEIALMNNCTNELIKLYVCKKCGAKLTTCNPDKDTIIIHKHFNTPSGYFCLKCWEMCKTDYFKTHKRSCKITQIPQEVVPMGKGKNKGTKETKKPKGGKKEK